MRELHTTDLCHEDTPWCYFVVSPLRSADAFARTLALEQPVTDQCVVARIIQGGHCHTPQTLFQEWSAALQFPYYFGHNWNAFDECLTDLEWLPGSCYVFIVTCIDSVLPDLDRDFTVFVQSLKWASQEWKIPNRYNTNWPAAPFTVVFHAEPGEAEAALTRLRVAGADPVEVRFSEDFIVRTTLHS